MLKAAKPITTKDIKLKLRELILYISRRCETDINFGSNKLNKIILFVDILSYLRYGTSVTGTAYVKQTFGPVPVHLGQIIEQMKADREILIKKETVALQYAQTRIIPLRAANVEVFLPRDIALVEDVIHEFFRSNAVSISEKSHGTAWKLANLGDVIPLDAFLIGDDQTVTDEDVDEAYNLIRKNGWEVYAST